MVSRSTDKITVRCEIYDRATKAVTEEERSFIDAGSLEDIQNEIRHSLGPGKALIQTEVLETKQLVYEMAKERFFQLADCREVE
jgi:hypothetical protein